MDTIINNMSKIMAATSCSFAPPYMRRVSSDAATYENKINQARALTNWTREEVIEKANQIGIGTLIARARIGAFDD